MTTLALLSWVALIAGNAMAQASGPRADGFRGLILNQTSAEDCLKMLGQPAVDKTDRLDVSKVSKWLDPKRKEMIFCHLSFKNVCDFLHIYLSFHEHKLMIIVVVF